MLRAWNLITEDIMRSAFVRSVAVILLAAGVGKFLQDLAKAVFHFDSILVALLGAGLYLMANWVLGLMVLRERGEL